MTSRPKPATAPALVSKTRTHRRRILLRGNRKFLMASAALGMAFLLALLDKLSADFATVASVCVGAYSLANAYVTGHGGEPPVTSGTPEDEGGSA